MVNFEHPDLCLLHTWFEHKVGGEGGIGVHILGVVGVRQSPLCIREGTPALPKTKRPELASHSDHRHCRCAHHHSAPHQDDDILFHHQGQQALLI